ncbi:MAG: hypothetical protein GX935_06460 [Erysipelotrichia bacterium]|nr:hypothetical protein [Erysipelotrichia bacterium]
MDLKQFIEKYMTEYNLTKSYDFIEKYVIAQARKMAKNNVAAVSDEVVLEWILESEKANEEPKAEKVKVVATETIKPKKAAVKKKGDDYEQINLFEL